MTHDHESEFRTVILPFIIFTAIWGSTWTVIRGQLGVVPPQWSVTYRFVIAAVAMAILAAWRGESLRMGRKGVLAATFLGFTQFCINFDAVYLAERHITSGVVATVFALLLIPSSLLAWAFLGHRPTARFAWSSAVAVAGIALLFLHELQAHGASTGEVVSGIALTLVGMLGASTANVMQARPEIRRFPLLALLAWSMAAGAVIDGIIAFVMCGAPVFDGRPIYWAELLYLALAGSGIAFFINLWLLQRIPAWIVGLSSLIIPVLAVGVGVAFGGEHFGPRELLGAALVIAGVWVALSRREAANDELPVTR